MEVIIKPCCKCEHFNDKYFFRQPLCTHPSNTRTVNKVDGQVSYKTCEYVRAQIEGNCPNFVHKGVSNFIVILVILCIIGIYRCF